MVRVVDLKTQPGEIKRLIYKLARLIKDDSYHFPQLNMNTSDDNNDQGDSKDLPHVNTSTVEEDENENLQSCFCSNDDTYICNPNLEESL